MPIFQYRAYNATGEEVGGNLEALGLKDAVSRLKREGLYPKEVTERIEKRGIRTPFTKAISLRKISLITRQLATLLGSGATLYDALDLLAKEEGNGYMQNILLNIKDRIAEGLPLARALNSYPEVFSEVYQNMVAVGEASGSLDKVLGRLAGYLEARDLVYRKIRASLTYPILMTFVGFGTLSFLFIFVIPKITRVFEESRMALPLLTVSLIAITQFLRDYWPFILIGLVLTLWLAGLYLRTQKGKALMDRTMLRLPWLGGVIRRFYTANMARTLGSLLEGGIPMLKALEMTRGVLNHAVFGAMLDRTIKDVTEGSSLSASLKNIGELPPTVIHMIAVGEKSGELGSMLIRASESYERELEIDIDTALRLLEPALILTMGVVVGLLVLAILLPIFQLTSIVK